MLFVAGCLFLQPSSDHAADSQPPAIVVEQAGSVLYIQSGRPETPVVAGQTLRFGDRLRTLLVFGTNPGSNFPNLNLWRRRMHDLFVVYVDSYHNPEILEYADMILPCRTKH